MSVYRKTKAGQLVKVAGHLTQRLVDQIFQATYSINGTMEVYDITDSATMYLSSITSYLKFSIYCATPNLYSNVFVKFKDQYVQIYDEGTSAAVVAGQLSGKVDLYTLAIVPNTNQYAYIGSVDTTDLVTLSTTQTIAANKTFTDGLHIIKTYSDSISTIDLNNQYSYFSVVVDKYGDNNNVIQQTNMRVDNTESSMNMLGADGQTGIVLINNNLKNNKHLSSVVYVDNINTDDMTTNTLSVIEQDKTKVELRFAKDTEVVNGNPVEYLLKLSEDGVVASYNDDTINHTISLDNQLIKLEATATDSGVSYVTDLKQTYEGNLLSSTVSATYTDNNEDFSEETQALLGNTVSTNGFITHATISNETINDEQSYELINAIMSDTIVLSRTYTNTTGGTTTTDAHSILINSSGVMLDGRNANSLSSKSIIADYTLTAANWSSNAYTLSVTGKTATNHARVTNSNTGSDADVLANAEAIADANIYKITDNGTSLTFVCETTPTSDLKIQVEVFE